MKTHQLRLAKWKEAAHEWAAEQHGRQWKDYENVEPKPKMPKANAAAKARGKKDLDFFGSIQW